MRKQIYILPLLLLLSVYSARSMENQKELALLVECNSNNSVCLLPTDMLTKIIAHYYDDKDQVKSLKSTIANFMKLRSTCTGWNNLLTFEKIGDFCKNYPQVIKNVLLGELTYSSRLPILVLVHASIEPSIAFHKIINALLITVVSKNDVQLIRILLKHIAKPKDCLEEIRTVEIAQILFNNGVDIHTTDYYGRNILWKLLGTSYPSDLMRFYVACGVDARRLDGSGDTLLHSLARKASKIRFSVPNEVDDFLKKAELLITMIPDMINKFNCHGYEYVQYETSLGIAQKCLKDIASSHRSLWDEKRSQTEEILEIEALEKLIVLLQKNGAY